MENNNGINEIGNNDGASINGGNTDGNGGANASNKRIKIEEILTPDEVKYIFELLDKLLWESGWTEGVCKRAQEIRESHDEDTDVYLDVLAFANTSIPRSVHLELARQIHNVLSSRHQS
ncbi:hypothetical protein AWZ03_013005 [Drosophila navojoa]|uniref:Enhancer of yellow 2 transcription factor n=1 Tax=Drosophila navojoa TaxID=7232 RepID=A0A484AY90_DRONA|nr:hypothetical protein AWZ03_013005 [Drosophila navojoa]